MAPVASAQYHFVAMLTPSSASKLLSWISGWVTVFAWQANVASVGYLTATQIQALVVLNDPTYIYERWHATMIFWAVVVISTCVNVLGIGILPHLETMVGILHVCLWFVSLVPLVYLSPHRSASSTFTDFENNSGWENNAVSWCIGLLTVVYPFLGFEGVCHISEEAQNAALTVPWSMVISMIINGALGFGFLIGLLFSVTDFEGALKSPTKSPLVEILYQALQSKSAATAIVGLFIVVAICTELGMVASTSRLTWAFARDNGLPFSKFFAHVRSIFATHGLVLLLTVISLLDKSALQGSA